MTTVQVQITLDSSGAVTGIKQLGDHINKIPPPSPKVRQEFDGIESAERRAHIAGMLFVHTTGVQMPRALETVIARSRTLGPILEGLFNVSIVGAAGLAFVEFGKRAIAGLTAFGNALMGNTEIIRELGRAAVQASQDAFFSPKTLGVAIQHIGELNEAAIRLRKTTESLAVPSMSSSGKVDIGAAMGANAMASVSPQVEAEDRLQQIEKDRIAVLEKMTELARERNTLLDAENAKANEAGKQGFALLRQKEEDFKQSSTYLILLRQTRSVNTKEAFDAQQLISLHNKQFTGEELALVRESANQTIAMRHQVAEESVHGIARVHMQELDAIEDINRKEKETLITRADAQTQRVLIHKKAVEQIKVIENELLKQDAEAKLFAEQRANAFLQGSQKIIADAQHEKDSIEAGFAEVVRNHNVMSAEVYNAWKNAQIKIEAVTKATTQQLIIQQQQLRDKTIDLEQQAAIARLPEWQRSEATIRLEHEKTYQELNRLEVQDVANFALYERQKAAADVLMNARIRDEHKRLTEQLGADLQSVFDDISSGNIGKRILANMEKLFFQILAQWILSLNMMKSAVGSIIGSIVFGPGSTGAGVFGGGGQQGGGSLLSGLLGRIFGGNSSQSAMVPVAGSAGSAGIPGSSAGAGLSGAIAGTGATASSALVPSASGALTSSTMSDAVAAGTGIGGALSSSASKTAGGGLLSGKGLLGLGGLGMTLLGGLAGGKTGQIGGMISTLAMMGFFGGPLAPFLAAAGPALLGFGIGSHFGPVGGALAGGATGFGAGALIGLAGGPIGALIGGIVGAIAGLFGGIFGSGKRKKQANAFADNTVIPDIAQVVQGFDGFQIDSSSAIQQLEQLRTDSEKQLKALKGEGKHVLAARVEPAINDAEKHIRDTQAERDRRSSLVFGPPQFATGGMFMSGGSAGLAVLHNGEFVVNPDASKKNLGTLQSINAGGSAGGLSIGNLNINTRSLDRKYVMSREFRKDLLDALAQARREGQA